MSSPSLILKRLRVDGALGCDLTFHRGVNVVVGEQNPQDPRGSNACGKTTLVELIQAGLGRRYQSYADFKELAAIQGRVQTLWLEIRANEHTVLIERSLENITGLLRVRWEPYRDGIATAPSDPVAPEELSRLLLDLLEIPEVAVKRGDGSLETLTFQLLRRAFVLHQEDSFLDLLDKVQPEQRRTQIIGFLTNIRSLVAFELEERVGEAQRRLDDIKDRIKQVSAFLVQSGVADLTGAQSAVSQAEEALHEARQLQQSIQKDMQVTGSSHNATIKGRIEQMRTRVLALEKEERSIEQERSIRQDQRNELQALLGSISVEERKLRRLRASSDRLSSVDFKMCPRCLQEITVEMQRREEYGRCSLCARPIGQTSDTAPRSVPNESELEAQRLETDELFRETIGRLANLERSLSAIRRERDDLGQQLDKELQAFVSPSVDRLVAQADAVALRASELARARTLLEQVLALDEMRQQIEPLTATFRKLSRELADAREASGLQLGALRVMYEEVLRAVEWPDFVTTEIDSETLFPRINGLPFTAFGTGMKGVAVVCFHFAMLALARERGTFMPRLLVIDSPAVGDLNERNHLALLKYIASMASDSLRPSDSQGDLGSTELEEDDTWQVILTTRRMIPELEPYVLVTLSRPTQMLLKPPG